MIRIASSQDAKTLYGIEEEVFASSIHKLNLNSIKYHIKNNCTLLFESEGAIVGYGIVLFPKKRDARIYSLAVAERYRGKGIGNALTLAMVESAKNKHYKNVVLEVESNNTAAIRVYEKLGFRRCGALKDFYGEGKDGIKMAKELFGI